MTKGVVEEIEKESKKHMKEMTDDTSEAVKQITRGAMQLIANNFTLGVQGDTSFNTFFL